MAKKPAAATETAPPSDPTPLPSQTTQVHPSQEKGARANAITHGLTANKLLPLVLKSGRLDAIKDSLREELKPRTVLEELLVREAARHFASLEVAEEAEPAVLRQAARMLAPMAGAADAATTNDVQLFAAVNTEALERLSRYRRCHEKGAYLALEWLENIRAVKTSVQAAMTNQFATEADCESYLQRRFLSLNWTCPHCKRPDGHWLTTRKRWECAGCGAQIGLRFGTVFENSPLPLTTWFCAIRAFAANSALTANSLAELAGVTRLATASAMLRRLRDALHDEDFTRRFAGLMPDPLAQNGAEFQHKSTKRTQRRKPVNKSHKGV